MNDWIFFIGMAFYITIGTIFTIWMTDDDGYFSKRKLHKRLDDIMYYQGHKDENQIVVTYKDKPFTIKVDNRRHNNCYKTIMLYINEELVLTLHVLEGMFVSCRKVEINSRRYKSEIIEIVKAAVKRSKKEYEDEILKSYKTDSKSYFK